MRQLVWAVLLCAACGGDALDGGYEGDAGTRVPYGDAVEDGGEPSGSDAGERSEDAGLDAGADSELDASSLDASAEDSGTADGAAADAGSDAGESEDAGAEDDAGTEHALALIGASGFDAANRLGSAPGTGMRGGDSYTIALVVRLRELVAGGYLLDYLDSATGRGYRVWQDTATTIRFGAASASGSYVVSAPYYAAGDLGEVQLLVATHSGDYVDLWASNAKVGGGSATNGYLPASTPGIRNTVGARGNGTSPHTGLDWFAAGSWDRVLTPDEIHGLYAHVREHGELPTTLPGVEHVYSVANDYEGAGCPATVGDSAGADDFGVYSGDAAGLDAVVVDDPVFAWGEPGPEIDVWVAWGDSMADGRGDSADLLTVAPGYPPLDGSLWTVRQPAAGAPFSWSELTEPSGTRTPTRMDSCVGPWGLFAWQASLLTGRQTALVNGGVGGSRTDQWLPGQTYYEALRARAEVALSQENAVFRGFLAYIGPNDAAASAEPPWLENMQAIEAGLRARLGEKPASQAPAIFVELTTEVPTDVSYPGWESTRAQQVAWTDADHLRVTSPTATRESYGLHHTTAENLALAQDALRKAALHPSWD